MSAYLIKFSSQQSSRVVPQKGLSSSTCNSLTLLSASISLGSLTSARHPMSMSTSSVTVYFHQSLYLRSNTPPLHTNNKTGLYKDEKDKT